MYARTATAHDPDLIFIHFIPSIFGKKENSGVKNTCVTLVTVADHLLVAVVLITRGGKVASAVGALRTGAWSTLTP